MKKDIASRQEIEILVNEFYNKVRLNETLVPIFEQELHDKWDAHMEKMYRFWETVLLNVHTYSGSPFPPHAKLPIDQQHFDTWLQLFQQTLDENFSGPKADEAMWRAQKMAEMFEHKLAYIHNNRPVQL
jgi:hemoglobin